MKSQKIRIEHIQHLVFLIINLLLPLAIFIIVPITGPGQTLSFKWLDFLYLFRGSQEPPDNILIVAIDEPSFSEIGLHWPWPRTLHAQLIEKLSSLGAKAIAFDIMFVEPSEDPEDDQALADAARKAGNVIFGKTISQIKRQDFSETRTIEPLPLFAESAASVALVNFWPDSDGFIRHGMQKIGSIPTLSLAAAQISGYYKNNINNSDDNSSFLIDFIGPTGSMQIKSYYQVLIDAVPKELIKDKIVLIGFASDTAVEIERAVDAFPTPFFSFTRKPMFGVEIHANALNTLLNHCPLRYYTKAWLVGLFLVLIFIPFFSRKRPILLVSSTVLITLGLGAVSLILFLVSGLVIDIVPTVNATVCSGLWLGFMEYRASIKEKKQLKGAFSQYVAPDVVNEVLRNPELLKLGGQKRQLSVLFSDIRNFTTLSEKLIPEQLVALLNSYLTSMTDKVFDYHGTLDKYIGDAIMAIFGAPIPYADHAKFACRTAVGMIDSLASLNPEWEAIGLPTPKIGIGINTGDMVVGNIGSNKRFDYTVIGDEVNLASRLEGITKSYKVFIVISESTRMGAGDNFVCRELDYVRVKGKAKPIQIYELIAEGNISEKKLTIITEFHKGLEAYRKQRWEEARQAFRSALAVDPNDGPSIVFMERVNIFEMEPPPKDWDGVWIMTSK
ncbi:MAG: CHASE2 domain-containing protein [Desulfobacterales bacterium]|nr:CHASE2 domain-containing protein [Desulfobacterales bacterium]